MHKKYQVSYWYRQKFKQKTSLHLTLKVIYKGVVIISTTQSLSSNLNIPWRGCEPVGSIPKHWGLPLTRRSPQRRPATLATPPSGQTFAWTDRSWSSIPRLAFSARKMFRKWEAKASSRTERESWWRQSLQFSKACSTLLSGYVLQFCLRMYYIFVSECCKVLYELVVQFCLHM